MSPVALVLVEGEFITGPRIWRGGRMLLTGPVGGGEMPPSECNWAYVVEALRTLSYFAKDVKVH